jgi:hypothetical protein
MRVDHGRLHIVMTEQFLDDAEVIAVFQKMGGKAVTLMPNAA